MNELEQAKLLSIASKFAKAEAEEIRREIIQEFYDYFQGPNYELEKAKLLSIASKFVKSEANEVRTSLEQSLLDVEQRILEKVLQYVPEIKGGQQGERGFKGDRGDTGIPGENGAPGPRGDTGQQGLPGKDGARGPQGDTGGVGPKGDKGDQGERGEQGEQGIPGQRGQRGERGEQGLAGVDGASGRDGSDGAKGETGERGPEGVPGRDGKDGKDGSVGPKGPKGPKGDKGDPGSDADVTKLEKKLEQFTQTIDKRISKVAFNVATAGGPAGSGEVLLHRLDDVDYSSVKTPIPGQALVWNGNINKWQANTITTGGGAGSINVGKILANGVYIDTVANVTDLYFDDDSGFDVVDLGYGVAKVQMNSTFKYWNVNGSAGLTAVGLDTANFIAGSGMIISANPSNNSITFSATGVSSNVSLSTYLQVANANAKFATKAYAASNVYVKTLLANTNAYIATKVNTSTFNSALANTNNYIATKADTSTFNSALANTNSFIKLQLANTNASIASRATWASLISENTALRLLISDRLQVTNAISTYQTIATERAALANTNAFIKTQLANTNSYIASRASWSGLTDTNTAIRILVNDRLQIANAINTYQTIAIERAALANTNAFIKAQLANTNARFSSYLETVTAASIYATKAYAAANSYVNTTSANTNAYILSVRNDERAALANTNAFIKAQLANTNAYIATKITNAVSTTLQTRDIIPEANVTYNLGSSTRRFKTLYISGDTIVLGSANLSSTGNKLQVGGQTQASNDYLTSTYIANTTARTLINDRYQVANVNTNFLSKTLNGTSSQTIQSNIEFSANVHIEGKLTVTGGITTYSANNLSVSDNMIYLNAGSVSSNPDLGITGNYNDGTYHHAGFFRDASDNGTWKVFENYAPEPDANVYINTAHATFRLAPFSAQNIRVTRNLTVVANSTLGNTSVAGFLKLNGTDIRTTFAQNTYVNSTLANTNAYIATKVNTTTFNSALANTNSYIATKVDTSTFNSALANTNAYIGTQATRISLVNTNLTGTNTALHTLISDRLQVANAVATYQTKAVERAALANTNAYIGAQATRITLVNTNLIGTNTALRTLINDRLQVTNAVATYQTKATERAALANTNAFIRAQLANTNAYIGTRASWAGLTSTNTALRTLIDDRLQVANASTTYATKISPTTSGVLAHTGRATISTNLTVSGNTSVVGLLANNSLGTAGYVLKTNGTNAYWDVAPTGGGGGGGGGGSATVTSKTVKDLTQTDTVITSVDGLLYSNANVVTKSLDSIKGSDQVVTSVSGMLVALPTYLQVANAVARYATKASPTTSGVLAHTGRATISTNLAVSGNTSFGGLVNINYTGSANAAIVVQGADTKGGAGYHDFLMARNGGGGTNPNKWFRINNVGTLEIVNSGYTAVPLSISDSGELNVSGTIFVGGAQAVNGPAFSVYRDSSQTIPTDVLTLMSWTTEEYDTAGCMTSTRFTPTVAGYYSLVATVRIDGGIGTGERMISIKKNGNEFRRGMNAKGSAAVGDSWFQMDISCHVYANGTGDYFEVWVQQGAGGDRNTTAGQVFTAFQGCMMRGA